MKCPYCSSEVTQVQTGNENDLAVCDDNDVFDCDISVWQCNANIKHIFYADDCNMNKWDGLPEIKYEKAN